MPYSKNLPGEAMLADVTAVVGWLDGSASPNQVRTWSRDADGTPGSPPRPVCRVVPDEDMICVYPWVGLNAFKAAAREHGLKVTRPGKGMLLLLTEDGNDRRARLVVLSEDLDAALDAAPQRVKARPRWWMSQEADWVTWNAEDRRRAVGNPNFGPGNAERWQPVRAAQREAVRLLVAKAGGKRVTAAQVMEATGLREYRARTLLHEYGVGHKSDAELHKAIRAMMKAGKSKAVRLADVVALGVSRERAAAAIEAAGGTVAARRAEPDLSQLEVVATGPDGEDLVRGSAVARAYGIDPSAVTHRVTRGELQRVGGEGGRGKPLLLRLEQVRAVLG